MHRPLAIAASLVFLPLALRAEEPDDAVYREPDLVVVGQPPEVTGVEVFEDTPIQTEWVSAEEIEALPVRDAAGVVEFLAGIRTSQRIQGQEAAVSIEGMPVEYTEILVDGQQFSGEVGGAGDLADFSLENVERIEVLRGAQGVRYGSDAAGGVINVVTRNAPAAGYRVGVQGEGGTDNFALGGATAAGRAGPVGLSLSGEFDRIDGFDAPNDPDVVLARPGGEDSSDRNHFLYGKWDAPVGESVALRGNSLWRVEHDDIVNAVGAQHSKHTDTNWRANTGMDWRVRAGTNFVSDLTFYAVDTESQVAREFDLFENELTGDFYGDHFLETGPVGHVLRGGFELDWQRLDLEEGELPDTIENPELEAGRTRLENSYSPSVYIQSESALTDWLTLVLGVRGAFHSDFDPRALPQVALLVKPFDSLRLRASWGLGYRTPSLRDLYQPATPQLGGAYFLAGNEDLEAESSTSIRAGFEWNPVDWISFASTGFYNDIDDNIRSQLVGEIPIGTQTTLADPADSPEEKAFCNLQRLQFPNDPSSWTPECQAFWAGEQIETTAILDSPLFVKQNLDSVRTWGAESQLRVRLSDRLQVALDYTWLRTKVVDSSITVDELPNEPEHSVGVRTVLLSPWYDTQLTGAFRWRDRVIPEGSGTGLLSFANSSNRTDPSYQLDFRLAQPFFDNFRVHFDAINVTDERREDSYAIRGRSFVAGISGEFGSAR